MISKKALKRFEEVLNSAIIVDKGDRISGKSEIGLTLHVALALQYLQFHGLRLAFDENAQRLKIEKAASECNR